MKELLIACVAVLALLNADQPSFAQAAHARHPSTGLDGGR